jgi:hypothetical protein
MRVIPDVGIKRIFVRPIFSSRDQGQLAVLFDETKQRY